MPEKGHFKRQNEHQSGYTQKRKAEMYTNDLKGNGTVSPKYEQQGNETVS